MEKELDEKIEGFKKSLTDFQTEHKEAVATLGAKGAEAEEKFVKMEEDLGKATEEIQTISDSLKAEADRLKELELKLARGLAKHGKDEGEELVSAPEVKEALVDAIRRKNFEAPREAVEQNFKEHIDYYFGHLVESKKEVLLKNLMAEGSESAGGMWCPVPMDSRIRRRMFETSPVRQVAEVLNVNTQAVEFALDDEEAETAETGEINVRTQTDTPEFGKVRIDVHELYAYPKATLQLLEDNVINLEQWLSGKVGRKFTRDQNKAFVVGDGGKEAKGFLTYEDAGIETYERFKLGTMDTATAVTLGANDLIDLQSHLLEEYQGNAAWMMHRLIWAKVMKLTDNEGQYLLNPRVLFEGASPQLLGASVRMAGDMPKPQANGTLTSGQFLVTYGDFREGYTILDRIGINVIRDNITQPGFVKWNFRTRYGGGCTNFQALKRLKAQ